jgi:hypothetical protein
LPAQAARPAGDRRVRRARVTGIGFALLTGAVTGLLVLWCVAAPADAGESFAAFARALGDADGEAAAAFMLRTVPLGAVPVVSLSLMAAALLWSGTRSGRYAPAARHALYIVIVGDLLVRAWGINPVLDPVHVAQPAWVSHTRADPNSRVYVGGKRDGTLLVLDIDASRGYLNAPGLSGSASRAALSTQAAYAPSGWHVREMLSYDLAVLWPHLFSKIDERFTNSARDARDRFLDRTGVRFRILPVRHAGGRAPIMPIPYFLESFLFDWQEAVTPRVAVLMDVRVVPDLAAQVDGLFAPGWDGRVTVLVEREPQPAGEAGPPVPPSARFLTDRSDHVVIEAGAPAGGGYLVLLDAYSPDWRVTVDGQAAEIVRANAIFRAVRLAPGRHRLEFRYRPRALVWGAACSALALAVTVTLLAGGLRRRRRLDPHGPSQYN